MKLDMSQEHRHWMRNHPGERISIYDVPQLTKVPYERRFNSKNIKSAFTACGIYPFNRHAIPEHMFAPSSVTDLPNGIVNEKLYLMIVFDNRLST